METPDGLCLPRLETSERGVACPGPSGPKVSAWRQGWDLLDVVKCRVMVVVNRHTAVAKIEPCWRTQRQE